MSIGLGDTDTGSLGEGTTDLLGTTEGDSDGSTDGDSLGTGASDDGTTDGDSDGSTDGDSLGTGASDDGTTDGDSDGSTDGDSLGTGASDDGTTDGCVDGLGVTGVPGQVWLRLNVWSFFSPATTALAPVSVHPAVVITYACLYCGVGVCPSGPLASSQPDQPAPVFGADDLVLVIGPAVTVPPPGIEKVRVSDVKPSPSDDGTTKCQPSWVEEMPVNPSQLCGENFAAVVGIWLGLTVAANTPTPRLTAPTTPSATGRPTRRTMVLKRLADTSYSGGGNVKTAHGSEP
jgi:hypothetical protein